jgi:hypothetical protein
MNQTFSLPSIDQIAQQLVVIRREISLRQFVVGVLKHRQRELFRLATIATNLTPSKIYTITFTMPISSSPFIRNLSVEIENSKLRAKI